MEVKELIIDWKQFIIYNCQWIKYKKRAVVITALSF